MPRRKRTSGEGGRRAKVCRVEHSDEPLVISDSDHEEEEDCVVSRSSRAVRCKRRGNRSHLQEMTEEEMVDLAIKLSAQEANSTAQRQQLEYNNMQKAIAESLVGDKDSSFEASKCQFEAASSSAQPQQSVANVTSHLRRKLSYPSQSQTHSGRESPSAQGGVTERETTSPLPEMPDLSQTTSSHLSSSSSAQVCEPPAASQNVHESSQDKTADKQPVIKDSEEDELFRSVSQPKCSPGLPRGGSCIRQPLVYVEKLSQDLIRASTDSKDHLHPQDNAVGPTCASISQSQQEDSNLPTSHVFTQNDFKETTDLLEDKNDGSTSDGKESNTQIPDEDLPTCLSHKGLSPENTDADKCSSPSRTLQPSSPRCAPENGNAVVPTRDKTRDLKQVKDQITQVENSTADFERAPNTRSWDGFTSHMVLHLTDDDDEDDSSEEIRSPSPVFHDETAWPRISPGQPCISSAAITPNLSKQDTQVSQQDDSRTSKGLKSKSSDLKCLEKGECTVSYYWGVPFCPLGQNPDDYTRVIMCQLEVYEKSLKEARRELLRKAEWSQPVFPGSSERPFGTRRLKRYRAPQLSEDEEQKEEEGEKENKRIEVEEEREEAREESAGRSEEPAQGGQSETYLVLSSPETKAVEEQETTLFLSQEEPKAETAPFRNGPWDTTKNTQIEPTDKKDEAQNYEHFEEEEMVCPETQMTENSTPELMLTSPASPAQPQSRADSDVMEVDEEGGAPAGEEEVMEQESVSAETAPLHNQRMECPMCLKFFPFSKIEIHAAFCDGEAEDQIQQEEQSQVVVRRTRTRRDQTEESQHRSEKSAQMEKCSLCQGLFPLQDYPAHFHLCRKKTDPKTNQDNGPISAVQQTEQRHTGSDEAGPSDISTRKLRGPSDPALKRTGGGSVDCSVTTSSFNAFSPVSDDTERRTDLQQQDSSRNSQRLTRKRKFKK